VVLAILLVNANRVVAMDRLVEELWGEQPPPQAIGSLQALRLPPAPAAGTGPFGQDARGACC
jgi:hypothetical protein